MRSLAQLVTVERELTRRITRHGSRYYQWLPPQLEYLQCNDKIKLLRTGNQWCGKTTAGLTDVDDRATGNSPYIQTAAPPVEIWIVCASWPQSVAIQQKFWDLCDKDQVSASTRFDPKKGFIGRHPVVLYKNGSIVRFKTTRQGGLNLSSATIHFVLIDEPTESRIFQELRKRVLRTGGGIGMTLTPINAPTEYLQAMSEGGALTDIHYPLKPHLTIPVGGSEPLKLEDGTYMDEGWIAQLRKETLPSEASITIDGEWETRVKDRLFKAFDTRRTDGAHITSEVPTGDLQLGLGIDYGAGAFRQAVILVGLEWRDSLEHPIVWVLDEYVSEYATTDEDDARQTLDMLERWGFQWADLKHAMGDKPYEAGRIVGLVGRKSNAETMAAIKRHTGMPSSIRLMPRIVQAKTGKGGGPGSIDRGCDWLHKLMVRKGHFRIQSRCVRLIESLEKWDRSPSSEWKDAIDGLRYATWPWAMKAALKRHTRRPTIYAH